MKAAPLAIPDVILLEPTVHEDDRGFFLDGGALQRSTPRRKINREEHGEVPEQLMRWVWAGGRKPRGLVRRRAAEISRYVYRI